MRGKQASYALLTVLVSAATACTEGGDAGREAVGAADDAIVGGNADTTHDAVVAWIHGSKCSATIIATQGATGYALTAAHCVGGAAGTLRQGDDHNDADRTYTVLDWVVHPGYATSDAFDVAIVRFTGADGATPTLPVASKAQDNLGVGSMVDAIGFGVTPANNSLRRHVVAPLGYASEMLLGLEQPAAGICSGDSGGPSLVSERVVGVHSFVTDASCTGTGVRGFDIRAAPMLDVFINPVLNGQSIGAHTCDECADAHIQLGLCADSAQTCNDSAPCRDYIDCVNACTNVPCTVACELQHEQGKAVYDGIRDCACDVACASECQGDSYCAEPPQCHFTSSDADCQTCFEASCCTEMTNCAADGYCVDCVTDNVPLAECPDDPTVAALQTCIAQNCATQCPDGFNGGGISTGAGGDAAGGAAAVGGSAPAGGGDAVGGAGTGGDDADDFEPAIESGCGGCGVGHDPDPVGWLSVLGLALFFGKRSRRRSRSIR